jgi:hypothetical protein
MVDPCEISSEDCGKTSRWLSLAKKSFGSSHGVGTNRCMRYLWPFELVNIRPDSAGELTRLLGRESSAASCEWFS